MKTKSIVRMTLIAGLFAGTALPALAKEDEQTVKWSDVPVAVQNTITKNANGGTVGDLTTETKKDKTVYEAKSTASDGKVTEIKVAADGTLIKTEAEDQDKDADKDGDHEDNDGDGK